MSKIVFDNEKYLLEKCFDVIETFIVAINIKGEVIYVNKKGCKILEYTKDEIIGKNWFDNFLPEKNSKKVKKVFKMLLAKKIKTAEYYENSILTKSGKEKNILWHNAIIKDKNNKIIGTFSSGEDLSILKKFEENVLNTKIFFETILEGIVTGVWVADKNNKIYYANNAMSRITGLPLNKIKGINVLKDLNENALKFFKSKYFKAKKTLAPVYYEAIPIIISRERTGYQSGWLIPKIKENSFDGMICTVEDISEQKIMEEKIKISRENFKNLIMKSDSAMIVTDRNGIVIFVNPEAQILLGKTEKELIGEFLGLVSVSEKNVEMEIIDSGKVKGIVELNTITTEWEGNSAHLIMLHDITERKHAEEMLKTAEISLRSVAKNNADAMIVTDDDGNVEFINPAAETLMGKRARDLIGTRLKFDIVPGKKAEINISKDDSEIITAEIQMVEITWQGRHALLASLRDISEHVRLRETLRSLALVDDLTGLYNRRGFIALSDQQLKLSRRTKRGLSLIFIDLDNLKYINDNFGHQIGDQALKDIAEILKNTFRESDILARVGGDEFTVLAIEVSNNSLDILTSRLRNNINSMNISGKNNYKISISIGTSHFIPESPCSIDELINKADKLMYEEKRIKKSIEE